MKIVLDLTLNGEPKENDIIVFQSGKWKVISKESFFAKHIKDNWENFESIAKNEQELNNKIDNVNENLSKQIKKLQGDLVALAKIIKEK